MMNSSNGKAISDYIRYPQKFSKKRAYYDEKKPSKLDKSFVNDYVFIKREDQSIFNPF